MKEHINKLIDSDQSSFKILHDQFAELLFNFIWRKTNNPEIAQHLVQQLFIHVWNNRTKLNPEKSIKPHLYRIAQNLTTSHFRQLKTTDSFDDAGNLPLYFIHEDIDLEDNIRSAIEALPSAQRDVFYMSKFEGFKQKEIADILNISVNSVENQMGTALKTLRAKLQHLLLLP